MEVSRRVETIQKVLVAWRALHYTYTCIGHEALLGKDDIVAFVYDVLATNGVIDM